MELFQMQKRYIEYNASMFREGYFDDQFKQLQQLQYGGSPGFVAEVVSMYLADSDGLFNVLTAAMDQEPKDFKKMDGYAHKIKGSSAGVGAQRVRDACIAFRGFCDQQNAEECMRCLVQAKQEYAIAKDKLHHLLMLERQIVEAGGIVPLLHLM
ncbi:histidine-containing phosphotransfer protein 1 [Daucus carota subsp. sativus]|uniref:histidine-containing phosphotransfer protein 1 n=1 Tax=Daucus carota subsp. sativus TaxID=79200 RepID=UPI0007EF9B80|nr:PREDICTED: histidine-containing phosphotransfer protein 1-like [Daucus carota subsp. sativus]